MEIVWFILIGLVAGWLAGQITKGSGFGIIGDIVLGVLGLTAVMAVGCGKRRPVEQVAHPDGCIWALAGYRVRYRVPLPS